jgi:hypothetical protein
MGERPQFNLKSLWHQDLSHNIQYVQLVLLEEAEGWGAHVEAHLTCTYKHSITMR